MYHVCKIKGLKSKVLGDKMDFFTAQLVFIERN